MKLRLMALVAATLMLAIGCNSGPDTPAGTDEPIQVTRIVDCMPGDGDPSAGALLFQRRVLADTGGCNNCHSLVPEVELVGPSLFDIGAAAGQRQEGMDAAAYLCQSLLNPSAHVVEGFEQALMLPNYAEVLTQQEINDLVAFLLTETAE